MQLGDAAHQGLKHIFETRPPQLGILTTCKAIKSLLPLFGVGAVLASTINTVNIKGTCIYVLLD